MENYNITEKEEKDNQYYSEGKKAYKEKNWLEAIEYLEKSLKFEGKYYKTYFILGKCYLNIHKQEKAEELFKEVINLNQKDEYARLELGKLYTKQGKEKEAEKLFKEYIELDQKGQHPRLELGKLYVKQGKEKEAENLFKECIELDQKGLHSRLELGKLYAKQGKEKEAEELFKKVINLNQKDEYARLELGKLYAKQGKEKEAEKLFKECIELNQENVYARLELGKLYAKQGKEKETEKLFKERIKLVPKDTYARLEFGRLYAKKGKEKEVEKLFKQCIELDSKDTYAKLELGKLYAKQGKEKEAEKLLKECIQLDRKNVHARLELGKLYVKQGKERKAEKLFKDCIELNQKDMYARLELGKLYEKQGKDEDAEELFNEVIEIDSKDVYARLELRKIYRKQKEKKSIDMLFLEKKGENKKLQHIEDLKIREKIYLQKITEDDIVAIKQLLEQHKDEKEIYLVLIAVYERMGQKQNALNVIKRMQQNGIEVKGISIIKERIKSNKAQIYDMTKWDELIGWNVSPIEYKEENNITIENKKEEKLLDKEIPRSTEKENRGKKLESSNIEEKNKYIIQKGIKQESKGNTKTSSTSRVKENKEKQAQKIGETIRENTKSAVNKIGITYYAKMRLCSDKAEDIYKEAERVRKYIKKYDKLQSILECSEQNKRAKMELMLVLINEGYSNIVETEYPAEYKFINSLVEEYKKKEKTADVVKKEIDEYCL